MQWFLRSQVRELCRKLLPELPRVFPSTPTLPLKFPPPAPCFLGKICCCYSCKYLTATSIFAPFRPKHTVTYTLTQKVWKHSSLWFFFTIVFPFSLIFFLLVLLFFLQHFPLFRWRCTFLAFALWQETAPISARPRPSPRPRPSCIIFVWLKSQKLKPIPFIFPRLSRPAPHQSPFSLWCIGFLVRRKVNGMQFPGIFVGGTDRGVKRSVLEVFLFGWKGFFYYNYIYI